MFSICCRSAGDPPPPSNACLRPRRKARAVALAVAVLLAASPAVSSGGPAAALDSGEITLLSTLGTTDEGNNQPSASDQRGFWFTTGEASEDGYKLTSATFNVRGFSSSGTFGVAVHADATDAPGAELYEFPVSSPITGNELRDVVFEGEVALEPNTTYWIVVTVVTGRVGLGLGPGGSVDSDGQSDWSLSDRYYFSSGSGWTTPFDNQLHMRLRGEVVRYIPSAVEPDERDFAADASTLGRLETGTLSSGVLSDSDDRDLFKLEGLAASVNTARDGQASRWSRKRYRVQAWFGDHAPGDERGGEVFIMEAPSGSSSLYSAVSDTNEDGLSFFEFEAFPNIDYYAMVVPTAAIQVKSGSGYGLDNRTYTGAYKLQIDDVSHIEEMVTTLHLATPSAPKKVQVSTGSTVSSLDVANRVRGLDRAVAFYTGSNSGGYVLNRIEAAVSETNVSAFAANAKISIYSNDDGGHPDTEMFTLKTPADIWAGGFDDFEESFWVPSGTTADLDENTWYWVVFAMKTGTTTGSYQLDLVENATEDAKPGWDFNNDASTRSRTITNDPWTLLADTNLNRNIQIGVYASPNTGTGHKNPVPLDTAPTGGI